MRPFRAMDKMFLCSLNFAANQFRTQCCKTLKAESSLVLPMSLYVAVAVPHYPAAAAVIPSVGMCLFYGG